MSMKASIRRAVEQALKSMGDLVSSAQYLERGQGNSGYDPVTGTVVESAVEHTLKLVVYTKFTAKEKDKYGGTFEASDVKVLFPRHHLPVRKLSTGDALRDPDGTVWEITRDLSDAQGILATLQCQAT